jgi:hypothetical protein
MEDKPQEIKEEKSGIVILDPGIVEIDEDIRLACCYFSLLPIR